MCVPSLCYFFIFRTLVGTGILILRSVLLGNVPVSNHISFRNKYLWAPKRGQTSLEPGNLTVDKVLTTRRSQSSTGKGDHYRRGCVTKEINAMMQKNRVHSEWGAILWVRWFHWFPGAAVTANKGA